MGGQANNENGILKKNILDFIFKAIQILIIPALYFLYSLDTRMLTLELKIDTMRQRGSVREAVHHGICPPIDCRSCKAATEAHPGR